MPVIAGLVSCIAACCAASCARPGSRRRGSCPGAWSCRLPGVEVGAAHLPSPYRQAPAAAPPASALSRGQHSSRLIAVFCQLGSGGAAGPTTPRSPGDEARAAAPSPCHEAPWQPPLCRGQALPFYATRIPEEHGHAWRSVLCRKVFDAEE